MLHLMEILTKTRSKTYHIEAIAGDRLYVGTDIRADSLDEAETIMRLVFQDKFEHDKIEIHLVSEEWIN